MPLRAKIQSPAMAMASSSRTFASASEIKELPGDEPNDVLFSTQGGVRSITLNRPKKLNSLNGSMARKIVPRLREWSKSDLANVVVIKGEGRAFCAGGDVAWLAQRNKEGVEGQQESKDYFALEYKLDHLISTYSKPYVAFIDGITMGGGVGLSLHAPFRIATENTVFAMPETTIGFFPDVGASFFLPRMDGELGTYCALTSEQLKGPAVFYAGIATHYIHSSSLPDLEARLAELSFKDYDNLSARFRIINSTIEEFCTGLPHDQPIAAPVGGNIRAAIDYVFQPANSLSQALKALEGMIGMSPESKGGREIPEWAEKTLKTILQRSPTSVKVTYKQLRQGNQWSMAQTFRNEHAIASKFMEHPDFIEGVTALLVDKPKRTPSWTPATLDKVSDQDVDAFFDFSNSSNFELLGQDAGSHGNDYKGYPHAWLGLPRENEVRDLVFENKTKEEIVDHFIQKTDGKQGVKEKVEEILLRKTDSNNGKLSWKR
ncbi:related to 3-hydroxyisobutyryl-CoA hydrolase, mitochondrial precursor [Ramularia collo-cygni]|uniref:3-hydroxyisobutyryl-CoA hydrolase n=1 Tax=Ramularia collo-cygni TaxID=112498 RepID=A0A2D3VD00_9PEZI|nr:related to 3-hydroxyisobutyryl-CoA hydrolase, mitochondrial precursor [Ramularia collo-cygni]CZT23615.1 related to 3-hydroxyisobutyryl-CoA hydrolase, mitochondrial precursor [Ramularia collo-cygni]